MSMDGRKAGRQASASTVQPAVVVLCGRRGSELPSVCARLEGDVHRTGGGGGDGGCNPAVPFRSRVVFVTVCCL